MDAVLVTERSLLSSFGFRFGLGGRHGFDGFEAVAEVLGFCGGTADGAVVADEIHIMIEVGLLIFNATNEHTCFRRSIADEGTGFEGVT